MLPITEAPNGMVAVRSSTGLPTEAVMRSILQAIDDGVLLTDLGHRSLACNRRFGELFDISPQEAVELSVDELRSRVRPLIVQDERWQAQLEEIYAHPERRHEDEIELRDERTLRRVASPVYDEKGQVFGRLWTFSDVTEVHQRRRRSEVLRAISMIADPDPTVNLKAICEAITSHFGAASQINIVEGDFLRFHVNAGDLGPAQNLPGIPKASTYCGFTVQDTVALLIQDARLVPKYANLLPVTVGFCRYLGVPVRDEEGGVIGTLCIVDQRMDRLLSPEDVELMEMIAMRANAELARERYLAERMAEKDRQFSRERVELEEVGQVLDAMNRSFSLLFAQRPTAELLREQSGILRHVLGYAASAVFLRRPDESNFDAVVWSSGYENPRELRIDLNDYPLLSECATEVDALDVRFIDCRGAALGELLGEPWAAVACLPSGEWGDAFVVLGRETRPPQDSARPSVQLTAILDGVRIVLAAHALTDGIVEAHRALSDAQEKALRSEKLAVVGTLAASTAHDIRNITASLSMLASDVSDPVGSLNAVREQLDRFNVLSHRLLSYARPGGVQRVPISVGELLDRVVSLTSGQLRVSGVECTVECDPRLPKPLADFHLLQHVVVNLVLNAVNAMEKSGGQLHLKGKTLPNGIEIRVEDDGPGISSEVAERLFQPFASSRPQGFGLGLFSAKRIVDAHGGTIHAESNSERGTTFVVQLPMDGGGTK